MHKYPFYVNSLNVICKYHNINKLYIVNKFTSKKVYKKFGNHKKRTLSLHRHSRTESPQPPEKVIVGFFLCFTAPWQGLLERHIR